MSAATEFLATWKPGGPWVLTAIDPDKKYMSTVTFTDKTKKELDKWINDHNGTCNIYYHVNSVTKELTKKAERQDIKSVDWLHVDVDPAPGQELELEQQRVLDRLMNPPKGIPKPTLIVFSGGGYQGFWKLREPIEINGDLERAEDAKLYNIQLERAFGADSCHNIDRIMRLPGTENIPDAKKRKKGRKKALSRVVQWTEDSYDISDFTKAPLLQVSETGFGGSLKLPTNIPRLKSVDELPEAVPDWAKIVIVQGKDPDNEHKHKSRSEWLYAVCCELVRAQVPDEVIYSVITDPDFLISESVLDKGPNYGKYAIRQIERAKENSISPHLAVLNEKHAVIADIGGKCRVISEVYDYAMKRPKISRQSFEDFRNRYLNTVTVVGQDKAGNPVTKSLGKWWLEHPMRRQFETMVFAPGHVIEGAFNLWRGFSVLPKEGRCDLYLTHIRENLCRGIPEYYDYLLNWMARAVQQPDSPGEVAIVLRGKKGTGKSLFAKLFGHLWGRHFLQVSDPKHLVGSFNAHLRDCVILFGDEAFYAGDKKHESILKMLITEELLMYEAKGVDAESGPNYSHLILASNSDWVVPAGGDERRFFVLDVGEDQKQNHSYFEMMRAQMETGGYEALLHYLMNKDISGFNVRKVPKTIALQDQKILSFSPEEEWWYNKLQEGLLLHYHDAWEPLVKKQDLVDDYVQQMMRYGIQRRSNATALGKFLARVCPQGFPINRQVYIKEDRTLSDGFMQNKTVRPYVYQFPSLELCRNSFDGSCGGPFNWNPIEVPTPGAPVEVVSLWSKAKPDVF